MFTILYKSVGGRESRRYFKKWQAAKEEMLKSIEIAVNELDWVVEKKWDEFNHEKGIYNFEYHLSTKQGEKAVYALIDGYFEDEPSA